MSYCYYYYFKTIINAFYYKFPSNVYYTCIENKRQTQLLLLLFKNKCLYENLTNECSFIHIHY